MSASAASLDAGEVLERQPRVGGAARWTAVSVGKVFIQPVLHMADACVLPFVTLWTLPQCVLCLLSISLAGINGAAQHVLQRPAPYNSDGQPSTHLLNTTGRSAQCQEAMTAT